MAQRIYQKAISPEAGAAPAFFNDPAAGLTFYGDTTPWDNMALGAWELFNATGERGYADSARIFSARAGNPHWSSWGNVDVNANVRIGTADALDLAKVDLTAFNNYATRSGNIWKVPVTYINPVII